MTFDLDPHAWSRVLIVALHLLPPRPVCILGVLLTTDPGQTFSRKNSSPFELVELRQIWRKY